MASTLLIQGTKCDAFVVKTKHKIKKIKANIFHWASMWLYLTIEPWPFRLMVANTRYNQRRHVNMETNGPYSMYIDHLSILVWGDVPTLGLAYNFVDHWLSFFSLYFFVFFLFLSPSHETCWTNPFFKWRQKTLQASDNPACQRSNRNVNNNNNSKILDNKDSD